MQKDPASAEALSRLISEIRQNMEIGDLRKCTGLLIAYVSDLQSEQNGKIDRDYIGNLREKKRSTQVNDICRILLDMTPKQVENVHKYTSDEYIEPNHEAKALEVIMQISRNHMKREQDKDQP